jgi:hypothetical protein
MLALIAYEESASVGPTSILTPPQKKAPDVVGRLKRAQTSFNYYVRQSNHGVKEDNVLRLLLPVGIEEATIDTAWLASIHSWGEDRGSVAHRAKKTQNPPDPESELNTVDYLLKGLKIIDAQLLKT